MILTCKLCQSQFLTESDPHVVIPGPEPEVYCYCQVKGDDDQRWIDQLKHEHKLYQKHLGALKEENERLEHVIKFTEYLSGESNSYYAKIVSISWELNKKIKELEFENAKLRECVKFYADIKNWHPHACDRWSGMNTAFAEENDPDNDVEVLDNKFRGGKRARQVLKELENNI